LKDFIEIPQFHNLPFIHGANSGHHIQFLWLHALYGTYFRWYEASICFSDRMLMNIRKIISNYQRCSHIISRQNNFTKIMSNNSGRFFLMVVKELAKNESR
jgi:hypothetical protein